MLATGKTSPPAVPPNLMGCLTTTTGSWYSVPYHGMTDFPAEMVTFGQYYPSAIVCKMQNQPPLGDGKIFSYRTANSSTDFPN